MTALRISLSAPRKPLMTEEEAFNHGLAKFLEGDTVSEAWLDSMVLRNDTKHPATLYRLCLIAQSKKIKIGDTIKLKNKKLMSSADRPQNALYAGCSYNHDFDTDVSKMDLVLVELTKFRCLMGLPTILKWAKTDAMERSMRYVIPRIKGEREYIISGTGVSGIAVNVLPNTYLTTKEFRKHKPKDYKL